MAVGTTPPPVIDRLHHAITSIWPSVPHDQYFAVATTLPPVLDRLHYVITSIFAIYTTRRVFRRRHHATTSNRPSTPRHHLYLAIDTTRPGIGRRYYTTPPAFIWPSIPRHRYFGSRYLATSIRPSIRSRRLCSARNYWQTRRDRC